MCAKLVDLVPVGAARGCGLVAAGVAGMSAGHRPFHAARGRGPATAVELQWTCSPHSSVGGQLQTTCSWRRRSQQPQRQQT